MLNKTNSDRLWTPDPGATERPFRIEFLLLDAFSNHCLANALEPFRAANTFAGHEAYRWRIATLDGTAAVSSSGLSILPDGALGEGRACDLLFVVSSYGYRDLDTPKIRAALRAAAERAGAVAGMDTGAWLMAGAGLLDGRAATIHWDVLDAFAETFLETDVRPDRFVRDGDRLTCGGAAMAFDLVLDIIRARQGEALRLDVAALFLQEAGREKPDFGPAHRSRLTARAIALMQENIETPMTVGDIAKTLGCTRKQLERRFIVEFAAPPARVYQHLRLAAARRLLENTELAVAEIALRCGYLNPSAMSRAFKATYAMTPLMARNGGY